MAMQENGPFTNEALPDIASAIEGSFSSQDGIVQKDYGDNSKVSLRIFRDGDEKATLLSVYDRSNYDDPVQIFEAKLDGSRMEIGKKAVILFLPNAGEGSMQQFVRLGKKTFSEGLTHSKK